MVYKVETVRPKLLNKPEELEKEIRRKLKNAGQQARRDMKKATRTWETDVDFSISTTRTADTLAVEIVTDNEIFRYVNDGTEPHIIRPKNPNGFLRFQPEYSAKTQPKVLNSYPGGSSGGFVYAKSVKHPGTEARDFTGVIGNKIKDRLVDAVIDEIRQYMRQRTRPAGRLI